MVILYCIICLIRNRFGWMTTGKAWKMFYNRDKVREEAKAGKYTKRKKIRIWGHDIPTTK